MSWVRRGFGDGRVAPRGDEGLDGRVDVGAGAFVEDPGGLDRVEDVGGFDLAGGVGVVELRVEDRGDLADVAGGRAVLGEDPAHDVAHGVLGDRGDPQQRPEQLLGEAEEEVEAVRASTWSGVGERAGGLLRAGERVRGA